MRYCEDCKKTFKAEDSIMEKEKLELFAIHPDKPKVLEFTHMYCPYCSGVRHSAVIEELKE